MEDKPKYREQDTDRYWIFMRTWQKNRSKSRKFYLRLKEEERKGTAPKEFQGRHAKVIFTKTGYNFFSRYGYRIGYLVRRSGEGCREMELAEVRRFIAEWDETHTKKKKSEAFRMFFDPFLINFSYSIETDPVQSKFGNVQMAYKIKPRRFYRGRV